MFERLFDKDVWERRMLRLYNTMRHPESYDVTLPERPPGSLDGLRGHKYVVVASYRKDGKAVPTPLWFGLDGGKAYIRTGDDSYKVRRMRANPNVAVAPCTMRGKPVGPWIPATVRILPPGEHPRAIDARLRAYGLGRWLYDRTVALLYGEPAYLEVTAVLADAAPAAAGEPAGGSRSSR